MRDTEKLIRELAYKLWEQAGRPEGRSDEFWFAARFESECREETGQTQPGAPVRRRAESPCHESVADLGEDIFAALIDLANSAQEPKRQSGGLLFEHAPEDRIHAFQVVSKIEQPLEVGR
jgi:hypothetical protein